MEWLDKLRVLDIIIVRTMKSLVTLCLFITFSNSSILHAPGDIHGLRFISVMEGWMVGKEGAIFHTTDGGESFSKIEPIVDVLLTSVDFSDQGHGWAVGEIGTILHTDDRGQTWVKQTSPVPYQLLGVFALGREEAWIVGDWGTLLHTKDGGRNWEDRSLNIPIEKAGVMEPAAFEDLKDPMTGNVLVKKGETITAETKESLGKKGIRIRIREDVILNDLFFLNSHIGWIAGEAGLLLHTRDDGRSFSRSILGKGADPYGPPPPSLYGVGFAAGSKGLVVGLMGTAYRLGIGSAPPARVEMGTDKDLYSVSMSGKTVCIAGSDGTALVSSDGGNTFKAVKEKGLELKWLRRASATEGVCYFGGEGGVLLKVTTGEE